MAIKKLTTISIIIMLVTSTIQVALPMARAEIFSDPFLVTVGGNTAVTRGPIGTQVDVVGNATSGSADPFSTVTVYWDSLAGTVLGSVEADGTGAYRITVTIPSAIAGTHWIIVNDGETESGGAAFSVIPTLSVDSIPPASFPPTLALPSDDLVVTGRGFAPNDDITMVLNLTTNPAINYVITAPVFHTTSSGTFSGIITVPPIPMANFGTYVFYATDEAGNFATDTVTIDYYITTYPVSGPTGTEILIMGRIAPEVAYDLRFNGALIGTGTTDSTGSYLGIYTIPAVLSPGTYPIDIWWALTEVRSVNFDVTTPPSITLGATSGVAGDVVTITGANFVMMASITLYFNSTIVNSTSMDSRFGPCNFMGGFSEEFVVPTLTPGIYTVSVVDSWGATSKAGVFFTVTAALAQLTISFDAHYDADAYSSDCRVIIDGNSYYHGDVVSLSEGVHTCEAVSPADWGFLQWNEGDNNWVSDVENPSTMLTVTGNGVFGASWGPLVTFVAIPSNGGTITVKELFGNSVTYSNGQSAIMTPNFKFLTANPAPGYTFQSWSSTCGPVEVSTNSSWATEWTPTEPGTLTAVFSPHESSYSLSVVSDYGSPSPGVGVNVYDSGSSVTVSVNSSVTIGNTVWTCTGWSGSGSVPSSGSGTSTSFTITQHSTIIWLWEPVPESNEPIIPEFSTGILMLLIFIVFTLVFSVYKKAKTSFIL